MTRLNDIANTRPVVSESPPPPRRVAFEAPWNWLAAGWRDICSIPHISLTYGMIFTLAVAGIGFALWALDAFALLPAVAGGGLLLGPFIAAGLYQASERLALGERPTLAGTLLASFVARDQLAIFGAVLLLIFMIWLQLAFLLLMLFAGTSHLPPPDQFMQTLLLTPRGLGLLIVGSLAGGLIAALVFSISAVGVPLLMSGQIDAVTAARSSLAAVACNPKPMALWAVLIVAIMGAGLVTMLAGLIIAFPLIGHATWHAYADIHADRAPQ